MAQRIKVTGYLEIEDLDEDQVDLDDETGLSLEGYQGVLSGGPKGLGLGDLVDIDIELVDEP
jgi:hypothetical protein